MKSKHWLFAVFVISPSAILSGVPPLSRHMAGAGGRGEQTLFLS